MMSLLVARADFFNLVPRKLEALTPSPDVSFSAHDARGSRRNIVKSESHRDAGVEAHQADDVGDPGMAERFDGAVVQPLRDPARIGEAGRHLVDDLFARIGERG